MISVSPALGYKMSAIISTLVGDVLITRDEIEGLMAGHLCVDSAPTGKTKLTDWVKEPAGSIGKRYASELARREDRFNEYGAY